MNIKFQTRQDYEEAFEALIQPLSRYYSEGRARMMPGYTGVNYGEYTAGMEGFSRVLWGLIPYWKGGKASYLDEMVLEGITNGTDPSHPEYWGEYHGPHQAYVEMAALAYGILLTPEKMWEPLSEKAKGDFAAWIYQINDNPTPDNNWRFFRVLVNCALRSVGRRYSREQLEQDLNRLDEFYRGDGWYTDGLTDQSDYYVAFAIHFYSLLYAVLCEKDDPERCRKYRERARIFSQDFIYWFGTRGEALPFGRSLTYRFAQGCFWGALAFAGEEAMPWGVIKGIINRHFRWWFSKPILDNEDKLTLGYAYPNLTMCEGYNGPGSPYWAFKSFVILALPQEHPFWQAEEEELPVLEERRFLPHAKMLVSRSADGYVTALTSGQYADWEPAFTAEKYAKFAYSSAFGFQVSRTYNELRLAAPDNMLAFYKDGLYHVRRKCESVTCEEDRIVSVWKPMDDVLVETELRFCGDGHIRKHRIVSNVVCTAVEGGFALPLCDPDKTWDIDGEKNQAGIENSFGISRLTLLKGNGEGGRTDCEPNVNVLYPRTAIPYFKYEIPVGVTEIEIFVEGIIK